MAYALHKDAATILDGESQMSTFKSFSFILILLGRHRCDRLCL